MVVAFRSISVTGSQVVFENAAHVRLKAMGPPEFVVAGGGAGFVSGIARAEIAVPVVIVQTLAAALLLGGFHWWAARTWRRALQWIAG